MSFFKAYITVSAENLWLNPKTKEYEGCDPDSYREFDTRELAAPTLAALKAKISAAFFNLEKPVGADVQIFENRIEIQYQGEHDYRTPKSEQVPFIETASICIVKVEETDVDLSKEDLFSKIENR